MLLLNNTFSKLNFSYVTSKRDKNISQKYKNLQKSMTKIEKGVKKRLRYLMKGCRKLKACEVRG